jgi:hypothetical protein
MVPSSLILSTLMQLLVTLYVVASSAIIYTLMMAATGSCDMSGLTRATWRHVPENGILQSEGVFCCLREATVEEY